VNVRTSAVAAWQRYYNNGGDGDAAIDEAVGRANVVYTSIHRA